MPHQPSPENLRTWLARLQDLDGAGLSEAEAIDGLRVLEELKAGAAAAQTRITMQLYAARARREVAEGVPAAQRSAGLGAEVALARRVSPHQRGEQIALTLGVRAEFDRELVVAR